VGRTAGTSRFIEGQLESPVLAGALDDMVSGREQLVMPGKLGMRPLLERIAALQEKAEAQAAKASPYPDGLTQREIEVIRLVAAGKMEREIGEELFISINTAGNQVRNILNKTDSANG
jgi:DNA-binding NarL/FixJ family response regulator|tara:strand:+ start:5480 stop:5833 length:354 start_codon:yes stop_codon:yes gene_type:complete